MGPSHIYGYAHPMLAVFDQAAGNPILRERLLQDRSGLSGRLHQLADNFSARLRRETGTRADNIFDRLSDKCARFFAKPSAHGQFADIVPRAVMVTPAPFDVHGKTIPKMTGYRALSDACRAKNIALICKMGLLAEPYKRAKGIELNGQWVVYVDPSLPYTASTHPDLLKPVAPKGPAVWPLDPRAPKIG